MKKVLLRRIKKDIRQKKFHKIPDYEGFMKGKNGDDFYLVGWLNSEDSDLNLTFQKVDNELLGNSFINKRYFAWKYSKSNTPQKRNL